MFLTTYRYTLLFANAPFVVASALQTKIPLDALKDFAPITKVAESLMVSMVPSSSKFGTFIRTELAKWEALVKSANISAQ